VQILLDAHDPVRRGGTGQRIDWQAAAAVAAARPIILAGGLTPENVAEAVARVRPIGIDVSSGVEESPGIKNQARLGALFQALEAVHDDHLPARS
jgi:phosphoribosylanthranilate isomerase